MFTVFASWKRIFQTLGHIWLSPKFLQPLSLVSHTKKAQKRMYFFFLDHLYELQSFLDKSRFKLIFFLKKG